MNQGIDGDDDWDLPILLQQSQEALLLAQEAFSKLEGLLDAHSTDLAEAMNLDEAVESIEDLLNQIDDLEPDPTADPPVSEVDALALLTDLKETEAESFAEALRNMEGPSEVFEELQAQLTGEQQAQLTQAFNDAAKAGWHAYHVMIGAA